MFQFFPAPLENQCKGLQLIFCSMGKRVQSAITKRSQLVVRTSSCHSSATPLRSSAPKHPQANFSSLLTQLHRQTTNAQSQTQSIKNLPIPQAVDLINFFNYQKYYSKIELHCYVICLANLITLANTPSSIIVTPEFKGKIRRFLQQLSEENNTTSSYSNKVQAIFYILAVIIFQERAARKSNVRKCTRSIISDKGIMRAFLEISIPNNPRISKFYGIIMVAITTRLHPKIIRQIIVKNILLNISQVDHQPTLFNLLVYLRSEKNKVRISLHDLHMGSVVKVLIEGYQRHIEQYQSFYMLDYLNHLLVLFPSIAEYAVQKQFIVLLVRHLHLRNMHHPMHETTILGFISRGLKLLNERNKQSIINAIYELDSAETYTQGKIAKLLVEHQNSSDLLKRIAQQNFLMPFIHTIMPTLEKNVLLNTVELILSAIKKLKETNINVSNYMLWLLRNKLTLIGDQQIFQMVQTLTK